MSINWSFNPAEYEESSFSIIPAGDHRVRINDVVPKTSKAGNDMFEITFDVSGHGSKVWFYLVLDPTDTKKTNQRIGSFFDSFGITDFNVGHYPNWKGKIGAVRIKHEDYNGSTSAKVAFCLARKNQDKLPAWKDNGNTTAATASNFTEITVEEDDLPF